MTELKIGIVFDTWKKPIFHRSLTQAKFTYQQVPSVTKDTIALVVITSDKTGLEAVIRATEIEARLARKPHESN